MKKTLSPAIVLLAVAGGFIGGVASQWVFPIQNVHAQVQPPRRMVSQQFVLVDSKGAMRGEFKVDGEQPQIILYNRDGSVAWKATPDSVKPHVTPMNNNR